MNSLISFNQQSLPCRVDIEDWIWSNLAFDTYYELLIRTSTWCVPFLTSFIIFCSRSLFLYLKFLGVPLSLYPQHGHQRPIQLRKISQTWQRFWPAAYLPEPTGFWALCLIQIPLHAIDCPFHLYFSLPNIDTQNMLIIYYRNSLVTKNSRVALW